MLSSEHAQAVAKLSLIEQVHVLQFWQQLSLKEKKELLEQIDRIDISIFRKQQQLLSIQKQSFPQYEPVTAIDRSGNQKDALFGKQMMADGLTGCLILAGGQGSRLRFDGPKGMFPITVVKKKSLFQLFAEKISAAGKQVGKELPLAIMTSTVNHAATIEFFEAHHFFGLNPSQLSFFSQGSLPVLDQEKRLFLESSYKIAESPDGNGGALEHFYQSGVWQNWYQRGVRVLNLILIDNPLADPFDAELFGYHHRQKNEITIKCTERKHAKEQVGLLVKNGNKFSVVEYSELPDSMRLATEEECGMLFKYANLSLFCFSMESVQRYIFDRSFSMPLHKAFKEVKSVRSEGKLVSTQKSMAWKFEKFIFDLLPHASKVSALLYPRESCFAPLKNLSGQNSVETVQKALQKRDQTVFSSITGMENSASPFEISSDFYYPTSFLLSKWQGEQNVSSGYMEV
jgi:UDP-N-acetylglucosamine/UDP-N-acetylgalactosamine diphosphorylase